MPRLAGLLLALAACSSTPRPEPRVKVFYDGPRRPRDQVARLLTESPMGASGAVGVVTAVKDLRTGAALRNARDWPVIELLPGRYVLEAWCWAEHESLLKTPDGDLQLRIRSLRGIEPMPLEVELEAGAAYFVSAEARRAGAMTPAERRGWQPLIFGVENATLGGTDHRAPARYEVVEDFVWRPRLERIER